MDKTTEKGHSGVQVHSRGPVFPCIIYRTETYQYPGDPQPTVLWTLVQPGCVPWAYSSYQMAYECAIKAANEYNQRRNPAYRRTVGDTEMQERADELALERFKYEDAKIGFKDRPASDLGESPAHAGNGPLDATDPWGFWRMQR